LYCACPDTLIYVDIEPIIEEPIGTELVVVEPTRIEPAEAGFIDIEPIETESAEVEPFEDEVDYEPTPEHTDYGSDVDPSVEGSYEAPSDDWIEEVDAGGTFPHSPVEYPIPGSNSLPCLFYLIFVSNLQLVIFCFLYFVGVSLDEVRLALTELVAMLEGTFFRDYPLDIEVMDFLPTHVQYDWDTIMRDAITPAVEGLSRLSGTYLSDRYREMIETYQVFASQVYEIELQMFELHRHFDAARFSLLRHLSLCAAMRALGVRGEPAERLARESDRWSLLVESLERRITELSPLAQARIAAREEVFARWDYLAAAEEEDRAAVFEHLEVISDMLSQLEQDHDSP